MEGPEREAVRRAKLDRIERWEEQRRAGRGRAETYPTPKEAVQSEEPAALTPGLGAEGHPAETEPLDALLGEAEPDTLEGQDDAGMTPEPLRALLGGALPEAGPTRRADEIGRGPRGPEPPARGPFDTGPRDWSKPPRLIEGAKKLMLREIQANPTLEHRFRNVLKLLDEERRDSRDNTFAKIYKRALEKELDQEDKVLLEYARCELANRLEAGERLQSKIIEDDVGIAMRRDRYFRNDVEDHGVEKTLPIMKEQVMELATKLPPERLNEFVRAFEVLDANRNTDAYWRWEEELQRTVKKAGVEWGRYQDVFRLSNQRERVETVSVVAQNIEKQFGAFQQILSSMKPERFGAEAKAEHLVRKIESFENMRQQPRSVREADEQLKVVTSLMALTLNHDPRVRLALSQAAWRHEDIHLPNEKPLTFKEAQKGMREGEQRLENNGVYSKENMEEWAKRDLLTDRKENYAAMSADEKRSALAAISEEDKNKFREKWDPPEFNTPEFHSFQRQEAERRGFGGFLLTVLGLIFGDWINKRKQQLTLK